MRHSIISACNNMQSQNTWPSDTKLQETGLLHFLIKRGETIPKSATMLYEKRCARPELDESVQVRTLYILYTYSVQMSFHHIRLFRCGWLQIVKMLICPCLHSSMANFFPKVIYFRLCFLCLAPHLKNYHATKLIKRYLSNYLFKISDNNFYGITILMNAKCTNSI